MEYWQGQHQEEDIQIQNPYYLMELTILVNIGATPLNLRCNRLDTFSFSAWVKVDTTQDNVIIANQLAPSTNYRGYYFAVNTSNKVIVLLRSTLSA
jgi:hypothetical protein